MQVLATNSGNLIFQIGGGGEVDCEVKISIKEETDSAHAKAKYILLPFKISNDFQIRIQDDIIYSYKIISKKYTLLSLILPKDEQNILFSLLAVNNNIATVENKSKIEVDFNYNDIPVGLSELIKSDEIIYRFNIFWKTPRKLLDEEISYFPPVDTIRDSTGAFNINYDELFENNPSTWFVYPNFKTKSDQKVQFYFLLLIGFLTGLAQLNPIFERKTKLLKYQTIAGIILIGIITVLYFIISKESFQVVRIVSAPIVPHFVYVLGGMLYLTTTNKYLHKISGIIKDEANDPLKYADVELYKSITDANNDNIKPQKGLYDLTQGRFEFLLLDRTMKSYTLKIHKKNWETIIKNIPEHRDKAYELPNAVILKKNKKIAFNRVESQ